MTEPFIGEIRVFAGTFAPSGWAFCDGRLLSISENDTLYALIGTTYGGDGETTFGLPDLQGRSAVHAGRTPSTGRTYTMGEKAGDEHVTLVAPQLPPHTHPATYAANATSTSPDRARWAAQAANAYSDGPDASALRGDAIAPAGGNQPHDNMPPFVVVSYIIALWGIFPPRY